MFSEMTNQKKTMLVLIAILTIACMVLGYYALYKKCAPAEEPSSEQEVENSEEVEAEEDSEEVEEDNEEVED